MYKTITDLLGADVYYAHAVCLTNDPVIIAFYVVGDLTTWLSYMIMGGTLLIRQQMVMTATVNTAWLYGLFIFLCGMSHLTKTLVMFTGIYRLDLVVVAMMAVVSAMTAWITWSSRYVRAVTV